MKLDLIGSLMKLSEVEPSVVAPEPLLFESADSPTLDDFEIVDISKPPSEFANKRFSYPRFNVSIEAAKGQVFFAFRHLAYSSYGIETEEWFQEMDSMEYDSTAYGRMQKDQSTFARYFTTWSVSSPWQDNNRPVADTPYDSFKVRSIIVNATSDITKEVAMAILKKMILATIRYTKAQQDLKATKREARKPKGSRQPSS